MKNKFRGKDDKSGRWIYGDLRSCFCRPHIVERGIKHYVDTTTIGQLTGKKDCINQDIYGGDIVKWEYDHTNSSNFAVGVVYYDEDNTCYMFRYTDYRAGYMDTCDNIEYLYCLDSEDIEVLDNIIDEPELINNYQP